MVGSLTGASGKSDGSFVAEEEVVYTVIFESVDLVENGQFRYVASPNIAKDRSDCLHLCFGVEPGTVYNVKKQVGLRDFFERGFECVN